MSALTAEKEAQHRKCQRPCCLAMHDELLEMREALAILTHAYEHDTRPPSSALELGHRAWQILTSGGER